MIWSAPLGRLRETAPLTRAQALAVADALRARVSAGGALRTWAEFHAFVDRLPRWEDADGDIVLDGDPYTVNPS